MKDNDDGDLKHRREELPERSQPISGEKLTGNRHVNVNVRNVNGGQGMSLRYHF